MFAVNQRLTVLWLAVATLYSSGVQQPVLATAVLSRHSHPRYAAPSDPEQGRADSSGRRVWVLSKVDYSGTQRGPDASGCVRSAEPGERRFTVAGSRLGIRYAQKVGQSDASSLPATSSSPPEYPSTRIIGSSSSSANSRVSIEPANL
jgi:hypothetical protein